MTDLTFYVLVFLAVGTFFLFIHLMIGKLIRPARPDQEKLTIYECGEPTVGSAWVQFDLRYYVVALLFVIFDVEVAFFFPWAVVFGNVNNVAKNPDADVSELIVGLPVLPPEDPNRVTQITAEAARSWAWVSFVDILVFFGVLMVGFAYLWRRGDINWIRSTSAEKVVPKGPEELPVRVESA